MSAQKKAVPAKVTTKNPEHILDEYHSRLVMFFFLAVALFGLALVILKTNPI